MTSEQQDFSSAEAPPQIIPQTQTGIPGQGQSKSSRRRRRKRNKNKVPGAPQAAGQQPEGEFSSEGSVTVIQASTEPGMAQQNGNGGAPTKRWKKKKYRAGGGSNGGGSNANPGNQMSNPGNGNGGGRSQRRGKQKGPRSFVGPMDHSYRDGIGNYADAPPSTIEIHGNHGGNGGHRQRHFNGGADTQAHFNLGTREVIPKVPEGVATHIYCFIDDLFFVAKIQETARKLGVKVAFVKNEKESMDTLLDAADGDSPALIVFDLNNAAAKPMTLIPKLKTKFKKTASIVGFLSHLQGDLKAKAMEAGCDSVMPRSAFSQNLPNMLRRYGIEEEEEDNFNA